jgi:hypothetical protein
VSAGALSSRRRRAVAATALSAYALLACTACGATPAAREARSGKAHAPSAAAASGGPAGRTASETPASCQETIAATLAGIAGRIYHSAATGTVLGQAVHRLRSSTALARAVSSGSAAATRSALDSLLVGQIARVEVLRRGRQLAAAGSGAAIAPVAGVLPGTGGGRFVVSVQADGNYLQVTRQVTGAEVLLLAGRRIVAGTLSVPSSVVVPAKGSLRVASHDYLVASLPATAFPSGPLRIALLVPAGEGASCAATASQTRTAVLGRVGERIYEEELHSPTVSATVRRMEATAAFRSAVAARDAAATRRAIIGFFAAHIHVVRVRVTVAGRLLVDVGGPFALAPVAGTIRSAGHVAGHFLMAIQDDAGYLRLARLFTGAQVLMRVGSRQVMGTLSPGPAAVPDRGTVSYRGHSYEAYSFAATAFPSGRLRISLLF